jgi:hypothetical protein
MWNKIIKYGKQKYKYNGTKHDYKRGTWLARRNKSNIKAEQKYRDHATKKGTKLTRRNKLILNMEQKYRNCGTKKEQG